MLIGCSWARQRLLLIMLTVRVSVLQDGVQWRSQLSSNSADSEQLALNGKDGNDRTATRSVTMQRCVPLAQRCFPRITA